MAKLIVEIPLVYNEKSHGMSFTDYMKKHQKDFFPTTDPAMIAVDSADLRMDQEGFYLFKLLRVED